MDGRLIFLHRLRRLNLHMWLPKADPPVRRGGAARPRAFRSRSLWREVREECAGDDWVARTKTDTGTRGEYPKALERTEVKELGKLTP